jgi:hypothetical protein
VAPRFKNEAEAKDVLDAKVRELRALGYERLAAINSTTRRLFRGRVQLGRKAMTEDFIVAPDGTFVGE